ncbi:MAG: methyltransferase domain-containing protein [Acidimicrobiaceae bacterium]|nr:methyltransferase domain-containing protein [Acidimicrobiaceae bacterium]
MGERAGPEDLEDLLDQLRARLASRQAAGDYPPELEVRTSEYANRVITSYRPTQSSKEIVREAVDQLEAHGGFTRARIPMDSRVPLGNEAHRAIGKAVSRQIGGVLEQMQEYANHLREVLNTIADRLDSSEHPHPDLAYQIDVIIDRLADLEAATGGASAASAPDDDLARRVDALEAAEAERSWQPLFDTGRFERRFRGSEQELREHYQDLAERFVGRDPVIDLGCGQGEFVELLRDLGVRASGIDPDASSVAAARSRGLPVTRGEALTFLTSLPDGELGGVALIQVIERLGPKPRAEVIALAYEKLRSGGLLVVESINPMSLHTFANAQYIDPTHTVPFHPRYAAFLCEELGFEKVLTEWRSPSHPSERLSLPPGYADLAPLVDRLNGLLFGPNHFAIIATK